MRNINVMRLEAEDTAQGGTLCFIQYCWNRRLQWAGYVARLGEIRNTYSGLEDKPLGD
jgi:hypothetical protein